MKRIIAGVLSVIFLIGLIPAAFASTSFTVTATPDKGKVEVGETITVTVSLSDTEESTSGAIELGISDGLEVVSGEMLGTHPMKSFDIRTLMGVVGGSFTASSFDGEFASITVRVLEDAPQIMTVTVKLNPSGAEQTVEVTLNEDKPNEGPTCTASLSLNENVDIKIYVDGVTSEMTSGGYYVEYSTDGWENYSEAAFDEEHLDESGKYVFMVASFSANQFTKEVLFRICDGDKKEVKNLSSSVKEYCDYQRENSSDERLKTLCGALMAYGFFAQLRFPGTASELIGVSDYAIAISNVAAVSSRDLPAYTASAYCSAPVTGASASLSLESETKLNFYLKGVDSIDGITLLVGGLPWSDYKISSIETPNGDSKCCIRINGLNTVDLTKSVMLIYRGTVVNYSPVAYMDYAIKNNTYEINVCKALFLYVKAAQDYFNS
ncbi:MAG: hypothetical protein IJK58_03115 [Clostridia bacterium]|nr:hypothetical protein [Clostridia bacterium]